MRNESWLKLSMWIKQHLSLKSSKKKTHQFHCVFHIIILVFTLILQRFNGCEVLLQLFLLINNTPNICTTVAFIFLWKFSGNSVKMCNTFGRKLDFCWHQTECAARVIHNGTLKTQVHHSQSYDCVTKESICNFFQTSA